MRYYTINLNDATSGSLLKSYTSLTTDGSPNPSALQVELDVITTQLATPVNQSLIRIHGVPLADISQSSNFNNASLQLYAGMSKGLPLANPNQAGLLLQGTVFQSFGNWIGTEMSLDLIVTTDGGSPDKPKNIVLDWGPGVPLGQAVANALATAFPGYNAPVVTSSSSLVRQDRTLAYYQSVEQLAEQASDFSREINKDPNYGGLQIAVKQNQFLVYDGTSSAAPKQLSFLDLIGQPTWIEALEIQVTTVMRSDISVGDYVTLPTTQVSQTAASQPQARDNSVFQGTFQVDFVRHVGNYRSSGAQSWVSTFNMHPAVSTS